MQHNSRPLYQTNAMLHEVKAQAQRVGSMPKKKTKPKTEETLPPEADLELPPTLEASMDSLPDWLAETESTLLSPPSFPSIELEEPVLESPTLEPSFAEVELPLPPPLPEPTFEPLSFTAPEVSITPESFSEPEPEFAKPSILPEYSLDSVPAITLEPQPPPITEATEPSLSFDDILATLEKQQAAPPAPPVLRIGKQYVILALAGIDYAVPIENIREVGHVPNVSIVPHLPEWVLGITNIRGEIISVVDMSTLVGTASTDASRSRMLLAQTKAKDLHIAFIVDRIHRIRYIPPTQFQPVVSETPDALSPFVLGSTEVDGKPIFSLDMEKLLSSEQVQIAA